MSSFQTMLMLWLARSSSALLQHPHAMRSPHCMLRSRLHASSARPPTTPDRRWEVKAIGRVESSYLYKLNTPRQATILPKLTSESGEVIILKHEIARLVLFPGYEDCLLDLQNFDYIWVISWMHFNTGFKTRIQPQVSVKDVKVPQEVGLFSSRSPHRPNPIALSALKLVSVDPVAGVVEVEGLDLVNGTPILDIKPYIPAYDAFPEASAGWMDDIADAATARRTGYQDIRSPRGERQGRSAKRKQQRLLEEQQKLQEEQQKNEDAVSAGGTEVVTHTLPQA